MDIQINNKTTGSVLGKIDQTDLQFLIDQLEEESSRDRDYFIDQATIDMLENEGGSAALISMLRLAVGTSEGIDIAWDSK
jgi:inactivated superfamily I helicase